MWKQVKTLEASSINETQTKKEEIDRKITELRNQMQKYHTAALRMKSKLIEQGTIPANSTPIGSPTPVSNTDPTPIANTTNTSNVTPPTEKAEENSKPNVKPPSTTTTTTSKSKPKPLSTTATNSTTKTSTPSKGSGSSKSNNRSSSQNTPGTSTSASATKTASVSTEKMLHLLRQHRPQLWHQLLLLLLLQQPLLLPLLPHLYQLRRLLPQKHS